VCVFFFVWAIIFCDGFQLPVAHVFSNHQSWGNYFMEFLVDAIMMVIAGILIVTVVCSLCAVSMILWALFNTMYWWHRDK